MSSTSALDSIRFEIVFCQEYFLFEIQIQIQKGGVPVGSLLGAPDPSKTQVVQDPKTGESKAKMTEVKVDSAQILLEICLHKKSIVQTQKQVSAQHMPMRANNICLYKGASSAGQGDTTPGQKQGWFWFFIAAR